MQVDQALDIQPHIVMPVHEADAYEGLPASEPHLPLGITAEQKVNVEVIGHNRMAFILPGLGHHREFHPVSVAQLAPELLAFGLAQVFREHHPLQHPALTTRRHPNLPLRTGRPYSGWRFLSGEDGTTKCGRIMRDSRPDST
jgi:hypothetical protein